MPDKNFQIIQKNSQRTESCSNELSREQRELIHNATIDVLQHTGMAIVSPELRALAADHGLDCRNERIRFNPEHIEEALKSVGRKFTLLARNPANSLDFARGSSFVGMGRSAPFIALATGKQRVANTGDYIELLKLGQLLDPIELPGQLVYPGNIDTDEMYRYMMVNQLLYTDKPFCLLHESDIDLLCLAFDIDYQTLADGLDQGKAYAQTTVNTHSPLTLTEDQGHYLIVMARAGIPIAISPTPAAGLTGPCSLAGNLVLNNAEILGTLVLSQLVRPGLPILYSTFPCSSDMRSLAATYGGPETRIMETGAASMAEHYQLLSRGNVCVSDGQDLDYQAGAESMFNAVTALKNRITYLPGCGITSGFAMASREKLVLDAELVSAARRYCQPIDFEHLQDAVSLIQETGPRGSFITSPHTYSSFRTELFHPELCSRISNEHWVKRGKSLMEKASEHADKLLEKYSMPEMDSALKQHLTRISGQ